MDPITMMAIGSMAGQGIGSFLGGRSYKNPAKKAMPYLNDIAGTISPYFQPYINAGNQALPSLQQQYGQLLSDPGKLMSQFGQGYQQSPGYQFQLNQALQGANQSAAAGGMAGSPMAQQQSGEIASNMANQDYYNYLSRVMGMYGQGLSGMQDMGHMGMQASMGLGEDLASSLMAQAKLAYEGQNAENQHKSGGAGGLFGGIGSLMGLFGGK